MKDTRSELDSVSKQAFGRERLLEVVTVLLNHEGLASAQELSQQIELSASSVYKELEHLQNLNLVQRVTPDRTVLYQRLEGPFWEWSKELIASVRDRTR